MVVWNIWLDEIIWYNCAALGNITNSTVNKDKYDKRLPPPSSPHKKNVNHGGGLVFARCNVSITIIR